VGLSELGDAVGECVGDGVGIEVVGACEGDAVGASLHLVWNRTHT
jgi:hypothetical protein